MNMSFLSIETSLNRIFLVLYCNRKLFSNNKLIKGSIEVEINQMLNDILSKGNIGFDELDFIMVSLGPGSYTGTRVGLAAAKAIAISIGKPIIGYTNFDSVFKQGLIDGYIKKNSSSGILIKANKYECYYQKISENKFNGFKILKINSLKSKNYIFEKLVGTCEELGCIKNYNFCLPRKEAILDVFISQFKDIDNKKNKNLEPLYIKGHYAEKKKY